MSKERKIKTDPFTAAQEAANAGTDVSVGPGDTIPEAEGKRRPGSFAQEPARPPPPGGTPGSNPDIQETIQAPRRLSNSRTSPQPIRVVPPIELPKQGKRDYPSPGTLLARHRRPRPPSGPGSRPASGLAAGLSRTTELVALEP